ncbi:Thioredoxin-like fold,Thioredoxin domain [Cinara cedri]|uniref:Thioredoxin-like fold,Thioredoxin domain n=1 Tax=Cinara cedri TaxID=506608 RepID=A0A5E4MWK5_9HEMI|nr:Thioredoxin-like fold,Thioredoxin domain [Cinara cedri]
MYFEKLILLFLFTSCCLLNCLIKSQTLEVINDDELLDLFHSENHVLVLFTLKDCNMCKKYEETLTQIREEVVDSLNAWVVKVEGSNLVHIYDPTKEPSLVMFRYGVPLLIPESEAINEELLIDMILNNRDPIVKELNDNNFEHLTQASTGATTGDWFIKFYSSDSIECQRLQAQWETVGAKLKNRVNVARINRHIGGAITSRRFNINQSPTFILLRRGAMYKYTLSHVNVESLLKFVEEDYNLTVKIQVPQPKSMFDDFVHMCFDMLRENPFFWKLNLIIFSIIFVCIAVLRKVTKDDESKENERKSKKLKTSSKKSTKKSK